MQISLVLHRMEPHRQMFRACTGHIFGPSLQTIKMRHILGRTLVGHATQEHSRDHDCSNVKGLCPPNFRRKGALAFDRRQRESLVRLGFTESSVPGIDRLIGARQHRHGEKSGIGGTGRADGEGRHGNPLGHLGH